MRKLAWNVIYEEYGLELRYTLRLTVPREVFVFALWGGKGRAVGGREEAWTIGFMCCARIRSVGVWGCGGQGR